jgi:transcriptional/translational regulatory protein YebC/TACO1
MREPAVETICREGYGPGGVAVILTCEAGADVADDGVRATFRSHGGRLGARGSVSYLFRPVGLLRYAVAPHLPERALAAGAEEVLPAGTDFLELQTDPEELGDVRRDLELAGHVPVASGLAWRAMHSVSLAPAERVRLEELKRVLATLDGVRHVYTNAKTADQFLAPV